MAIPVLETQRLRVRPLTLDDLGFCHELWLEIGWADAALGVRENLDRRRSWLEWTIRSDAELERLHQPPYGERAVVLEDGRRVGLVGLVPLLQPFAQLPSLGGVRNARFSAGVGLFWAVTPREQRRGYASEAARALVGFAFEALSLDRIWACTERENVASIAVMRRLGMRVEENPFPKPEWSQVHGVLDSTVWERRP